MNFFKDELLKKRRFRVVSGLLQKGSRWMFVKFGDGGCKRVATLSLVSIFLWSAVWSVFAAIMVPLLRLPQVVGASAVFCVVSLALLAVLLMALMAPETA